MSQTSVLSAKAVNEIKFGYSSTKNAGDIALTNRDFSNLAFRSNRKLVGQLVAGELTSVGFRVQSQVYQQE